MRSVGHHQRVSSAYPAEGSPDRLDQVTPVSILDQVNQDFRVGLAGEAVASAFQFGAQAEVILDDPVVNDGHLAILAAVWVGVGIAGGSMGGPAGMPDTECPAGWVFGQRRDEPRQWAGAFAHRKTPLRLHRDTGAVVAPVL